MNAPVLTIAVPTCNRADLLAQTLDSVAAQVLDRNDCEVLVCDNASTDKTSAVVDMFSKKIQGLRYIRHSANRGIDFNIHACVEESRGQWVHLLSDDDLLFPGCVVHSLDAIGRHPDACFFFLNGRAFQPQSFPSPDDPLLLPVTQEERYTDPSAFLDRIWIWATFVSSFLLKRERWRAFDERSLFIGTDIYLSYALMGLLATDAVAVFVGAPQIAMRCQYTGNYRVLYAFAYQWRRLLLQEALHRGYDASRMRRIFDRTIIRDLPHRIVYLRLHAPKAMDAVSRQWLLASTWDRPLAWVFLYPLLIAPRFIVSWAAGWRRMIADMIGRHA